VSASERKLEAPHRRIAPGPRLLEKATVASYRGVSWLASILPPSVPRIAIAKLNQAGYLLWGTKRRWSNRNFGHVLGLPPNDPRVRRLALRAYGEYARYLVEVMRLPTLSADQIGGLVDRGVLDGVEQAWRDSEGAVIFAAGHVGNNEAVAAGLADRGWPISVLADDSSFPEMFELFTRLRESLGVHVIGWRNIREIYAVLRRREMLALLIDWGYRSDGIPVRLFGAWTTLPAGPAALAAKTGATIVPVTIRRLGEWRFSAEMGTQIVVASASPADLRRATQAMADSLERAIAAAPEQWYSFKPMWPASAKQQAELAARAAAMDAQTTAGRKPVKQLAEQLAATDPA
jgi:KDO2-lipid IV(A) lauroyltransferase